MKLESYVCRYVTVSYLFFFLYRKTNYIDLNYDWIFNAGLRGSAPKRFSMKVIDWLLL